MKLKIIMWIIKHFLNEYRLEKKERPSDYNLENFKRLLKVNYSDFHIARNPPKGRKKKSHSSRQPNGMAGIST